MDCSDLQIAVTYFQYFDSSKLYTDVMSFPHVIQQMFSVSMHNDFQLTKKAKLP